MKQLFLYVALLCTGCQFVPVASIACHPTDHRFCQTFANPTNPVFTIHVTSQKNITPLTQRVVHPHYLSYRLHYQVTVTGDINTTLSSTRLITLQPEQSIYQPTLLDKTWQTMRQALATELQIKAQTQHH